MKYIFNYYVIFNTTLIIIWWRAYTQTILLCKPSYTHFDMCIKCFLVAFLTFWLMTISSLVLWFYICIFWHVLNLNKCSFIQFVDYHLTRFYLYQLSKETIGNGWCLHANVFSETWLIFNVISYYYYYDLLPLGCSIVSYNQSIIFISFRNNRTGWFLMITLNIKIFSVEEMNSPTLNIYYFVFLWSNVEKYIKWKMGCPNFIVAKYNLFSGQFSTLTMQWTNIYLMVKFLKG